MNSSKADYWLQTSTSIAVLLGVLLVFWELRQTNKISSIERINESNQLYDALYEFEYENDIWLLVKKATESPQELTDKELLQLEIWLNRVVNILVANEASNKAHGLLGPSADAKLYADYYFASAFARAWLRDSAEWYAGDAPELIEALIEATENTPPTTEFTLLDELRQFAAPNHSSPPSM